MAFVSIAHNSPSLRERLAVFLANRKDESARRAVYRRTLRELQSMSARDLADIGIHASQFEDMARDAAYRR